MANQETTTCSIPKSEIQFKIEPAVFDTAARKIAYMNSLMAEIPTRWSYNTLERKPELWKPTKNS
jgi:hypothetical protein